MDELKAFGIAILVIIVMCAVIEAGILVYAYFHADKVKCNWLWCEFTEERRTIEMNSECYTNGIKVNCSDLNIPDMDDIKGFNEKV